MRFWKFLNSVLCVCGDVEEGSFIFIYSVNFSGCVFWVCCLCYVDRCVVVWGIGIIIDVDKFWGLKF